MLAVCHNPCKFTQAFKYGATNIIYNFVVVTFSMKLAFWGQPVVTFLSSASMLLKNSSLLGSSGAAVDAALV